MDDGVFVNDPELVALCVSDTDAMKKKVIYHFSSIGTWCYNLRLAESIWDRWLMDVTRNLTEIIANNLTKFDNIKRNNSITK